MGKSQAQAQAESDAALKTRPGERVFTLRYHVASGYFAFAHCPWCNSSFSSCDDNVGELGWHRTMKAATDFARENLAAHEKHACPKKPSPTLEAK